MMKPCECGATPEIINVSLEEAPLTPGEYEDADRCRIICKCGKKSTVYIGGYMISARSGLRMSWNDGDYIEWEVNENIRS